ncbi:DNA recombination and repair protein RecO [Salisediminibacterium beveridgei]|uniref:DNA repair protein RecO n=2 Tax=Salisediminibacterium beveridgei TaxID=632773 RepID=A0A1D7QUA3_9BACI|nr:DNA recombination and repair protein RecO [Salisediminibacterium beveridgei]
MGMLHKVEGIVIRTNDYGETHKIVTIFTREYGKVALMARGAKRPKSRLASASQLFIQGVFVFQRHKGMGSLNSADIIDSFRMIRSDILLTSYGACMIELIDRLLEDGQSDPELYEILYQLLFRLNDGEDADVLLSIMEIKMMTRAGAAPVLHQCASCGSAELPFQFSLRYGGALCRRCLHFDPYVMKADPKVMKLLRMFQSINPVRIGKLNVKEETKAQLNQLIDLYYQEFIGLKLRSKRFLEQMHSFTDEVNKKNND